MGGGTAADLKDLEYRASLAMALMLGLAAGGATSLPAAQMLETETARPLGPGLTMRIH